MGKNFTQELNYAGKFNIILMGVVVGLQKSNF